MTTARLATPEQYLAYDLEHEGKHEYWDGEILAMAGAMDTHNSLVSGLTLELGPVIRQRRCRFYIADQRVKIPSGNYVYPDFCFACDPEFTDERPNSLINPLLAVEVSSPSTALHDRTRKLDGYLSVPSLRAYWIFESDAVQATLYERSDAGWTYRTVRGREGVIRSDLFDRPVALEAVYHDLDLNGDRVGAPGKGA